MKCPVCGANNSEDARFCNLCLTPFKGDKPEPPPITSQSSTPTDYPSDSDIEQPTGKHPGKFSEKFSDWLVGIGCAVICLILIVPPALIFLPPLISNFSQEWGTDCSRVNDRTFQKVVLESQIPVLVVFTAEDLWTMKRATPVMGGFTDPPPVILAVKEIIKGREYKNKIKFCKYYTSSGENSICEEYNIKIERSPTTIVFRYGSVFWRDGGETWCYVSDEMIEEDREKIEVVLREALGEM